MFENKEKLELILFRYWRGLYRSRFTTDDGRVSYWGYSDVKYVPISKMVLNMNISGELSDKALAFLVKVLSRSKDNRDPLESGGTFVDYELPFFKSRYSRNTFFKYKKELVDLDLLKHFGSNYYVFNPRYFNKIKNTKVVNQKNQVNGNS
ncbi:hypothetical protein [Polaribacter sp.]|uniref:hypothetical protein n=1 Tax=Polaribacter sp. TaxID=1920175 RepID=UPI003F6CB8B8